MLTSRRHQLTILILLAAGHNIPSTSLAEASDPRDPLERVNRAVFGFNEAVDKAVIKPLAEAYKVVLPGPARTAVANFFGNLESPIVIINDLLQGKIEQGVHDTARFIFNSTFGIFGLIDIATPMQLPRHDEDFGQTMGVWGVEPGWYLVVPLLGPSTTRDFVGDWTVDLLADPVYQYADDAARYSAIAVETIDTRSRVPATAERLQAEAFDPYLFIRDAYLQRRLSLVYDGRPPRGEWREDEGLEPEPGDTGTAP